MTNLNLEAIIHRILKDVQVELADEFDKNFQRQGFFAEAWARRKSPVGRGPLLISTGQLRRSIQGRVEGDALTFVSTLPYASIHNEGGEIKVTRRMKKFFWHKYYECVKGWGRKKNGDKSNDKKTRRLTTEAEFWKAMALMKAGKSIRIPRRKFLGTSPEVEKIVRETIEDCLNEYFDNIEITKQ